MGREASTLDDDELVRITPIAPAAAGGSLMVTQVLGPQAAFALAPYKSLDNQALTERIRQVRFRMGSRLLILGHHYQQDEIIALSDLQGDSYQLSQMAAASGDCRAIAFCGVHFMAETADILANRPERLEARGGERVAVV